MISKVILMVGAGYLIGSIPFGLIVGKVGYKVDIRNYGSGNIGATNILRILGWLPSLFVLTGDTLKGALAALLPTFLISPNSFQAQILVISASLAAILGHNFSLYLKFSGGKGIATAFGAILVLNLYLAGILLLIWLFILGLRRYVSLASITTAAVFPFLMFLFYFSNLPYLLFSLAAAVLVILRHRQNVARLLAGKEPKITFGQKRPA